MISAKPLLPSEEWQWLNQIWQSGKSMVGRDE
jgi:hypothetical protein